MKFRAWHKPTANMIDWEEICNRKGDGFKKVFMSDDFVKLSSTGLHDKNGKEIYEGDIVKYPDGDYSNSESGMDEWEINNVGEVVWDEENAQYDVTNKNVVDREDVFEGGGDFEVVGNKFEGVTQ